MNAWLVAYNENGVPDMSFALAGSIIGVGRGGDNLVQLTSQNVSKRHAVLNQTEDGWQIKDLDSSNGLFLNGKKISQSPLKHGDKITFGDTELTFEESTGSNDGHHPTHIINLSKQSQVQTLRGKPHPST